ncbi:MAG: radical SAM protein [Nanoarchaeota archaeon]|nr:radical SAM protein [Nanoarchaeota archaeon]
MKKLLGVLCEKFYKVSKRLVFILTRFFNFHIIRTIDFVVTYRCNSRCKMCDIWRVDGKKFKDIPLIKLKQILSNKILRNAGTIAITGGEPFIRQDLYKICNLIKEKFPSKKIILSTNGLLEKGIINSLEKVTDKSNITLILSLDSIKKNDRLKGIKGSSEKIMNTIRMIKFKFPKIKVFMKFTINPWNYDEILDIYELSKKENVGFLIKSIENLKDYITVLNYKKNKRRFLFKDYQKKIILKQLKRLRYDQLKRLKFKHSVFTNELITYFSKKNYTLSNCTIPYYSVFIIQNGDVYLCRRFKPIGNIYTNELNEIWNSETAKKIRNSKCNSCVSHYGYYNGLI